MRGHVAALVHDASALAEDCRHADVVVATVPVRRRCQSAEIVIDRFALWRDGGHALWLDRDGARVESVRDGARRTGHGWRRCRCRATGTTLSTDAPVANS